MAQLLLKYLLKFHTFLYQLIGKIAVLCNNGIHPKHSLLKYHDFFLSNIDENDVILDIGCGIGLVAKDLAKKAKRVVAIDKNGHLIQRAKATNNSPNIEFMVADATKYDFDKNFDVAIISNVLEHIKDRVEFLRRIGNVAKKILIRVPMLDRDWITLYKKHLDLDYRLDKTHHIEYTLDSFIEEMKSAGFFLLNHHIRFGELYAVIVKKST